MTKRENILLKILITLFILVLFYFYSSMKKTNIKESKNTIQKYEKNIQDLSKKQNNIKTNTQQTATQEETSLSIITDELLSLFSKANIQPDRYQLNKNTVDFTITTSVYNFLKFQSYTENKAYPYTLKNCTLKAEQGKIKATLSYANKSSEITQNRTYSVSKLQYLFPQPEVQETQNKNTQTTEQPVFENKTLDAGNYYKLIGYITEENTPYLYIKDINTSRILKIKKQDIVEETKNYYILKINEKNYKLQK